jgi:hypothetical protein
MKTDCDGVVRGRGQRRLVAGRSWCRHMTECVFARGNRFMLAATFSSSFDVATGALA